LGYLTFQKLDICVYDGNIQYVIDLERIEGFDWDGGNVRKSADKHGVSQAEAEQIFLNQPLLTAEDEKHIKDEPRFNVLGQTDTGRHLHVTFTLRHGDTLVRVISARDMNRKERAFYEEEYSE
jgi:uncharacterized DUF497 family protein